MSDIERAKRLLEKLLTRTQARGATVAEAETAAELAAKICQRYGLDADNVQCTTAEQDSDFGGKIPRWASMLSHGFHKRFGVEVLRKTQYGRHVIVFRGEEHVVRVAHWLYTAIVRDLDKLSRVSAEEHGLTGPALTKYRNHFRNSAAFAIWMRMDPPPPITAEEMAKVDAKIKRQLAKRKPAVPAPFHDYVAMAAGDRVGRELSLSTAAVGDRRRAVACIS